MRLSTQHKKLSELVFYQDILEYFRNMDGLREISKKFWHKSGKYFYQVNHIFASNLESYSRDDRYAVVEIYSSDVNYHFGNTWGHVEQRTLVTRILLAPKGPAPALKIPEISLDLNSITIGPGTSNIINEINNNTDSIS